MKELTEICLQYVKDYFNEDLKNINIDKIKNIYKNLIECINYHNYLYYQKNAPIISDKQYDDMFTLLKKIENIFPNIVDNNSPTQKLTNQVQTEFKKAKHIYPMLSLENSYNAQDLFEREKRIINKLKQYYNLQKEETKNNNFDFWSNNPRFFDSFQERYNSNIKFIIEPKFDGLSIDLIYKNWKLLQAITRWDWIWWEDVTLNIKTLDQKYIPHYIPKLEKSWIVCFRWEVVIPKSKLIEINKQREEQGLSLYANTRNLAAWSLKQLDPNVTKQRELQCFVYEVFFDDPKILQKNIKKMSDPAFLRESWFQYYSVSNKIFDNIDEVVNFCTDKKIKEILSSQDIEFDWLVVKVYNYKFREILWATAHHPRRAIAYKFPAEQETAQILSVDFQVWRTWIITPVANITPTKLSWATIKRVSLHNFDFIKQKDIQIWDYVWIQRSWEVIPYIVWVIKERRKNTQKILPPSKCPSCWHKIILKDSLYYCINPNCPASLKEKIIYFVSRDWLNIQWFGESIIEILLQQKIIKKITDIYSLLDLQKQIIIKHFPWFDDKKVSNLVENIKKSLQSPLWRIISALGISWIWPKMAKVISNEIFKVVDKNFITMSELCTFLQQQDFLSQIYWLGEKIVNECKIFTTYNKEIFDDLQKVWMIWFLDNLPKKDTKITFCITWTFPIARDQMIELFEKEWFKYVNNISSKLWFLLVWQKWWSKLQKAKNIWIKIFDRDSILQNFKFVEDYYSKQKNAGSDIFYKNRWPQQQSLF